tara:strand:- start:3596 stop:4858 length:1263 start_codon:yes stop_codon:yes gene_type:complete
VLARRISNNIPFYYGWIVLFSVGTSAIVRNAAASLMIGVFIASMNTELGWSRTLIAGAASVGGLAASIASIPAGWVVDKYKTQIVLSISVLLLGIATISISWVTTPLAFYIAYGLGRVLFNSTFQIGSSVCISRWFVRYRGRATGFLFSFHSIGMLAFPLLAWSIIQWYDWRSAWLVIGILVIILSLPFTLLFIEHQPENLGLLPDGDSAGDITDSKVPTLVDEISWTLREAAKTKVLWILAFSGGILFLLQSGMNVHQAALIADKGLAPWIAIMGVSCNAIFTGVGSVIWGRILEFMPAKYAYSVDAMLLGTTLGLFTLIQGPVSVFILSSLFGLAIAGILCIPPVTYANYFGRNNLGKIRGITEPFISLGQAIGALTSGIIFDIYHSYDVALLSYCILGIVAGISFLIIKKPEYTSTR